MSRLLPAIVVALSLFMFAACGDDDDEGDGGPAEVASLDDCTPDQLETFADGKLTIATDDPAYEPYFVDSDPTNGEGFESALAYAIADTLGFAEEDVEWVVVPFNASYAPGPKEFDFDVNQISIRPKRAEQVDFSIPYYTSNQSVIALRDSDAADATSLADLADDEIGVQVGTTSLEAVEAEIQPEREAQVFDNSNDVVTALKQGGVEAAVFDTPTAFILTATQVPEAEIVGQFEAPGGDEWGALLEKDSPLTACVSAAILELQDSGELDQITEEWMSQAADVPRL